MPVFIHTADWQIGRQYSRFAPEDAVALAEARFTVVERIAGLAAERAVDAVLVAGDVFDAQSVSDRTIRRLFNAMRGFSGVWIMIPGNHDAGLAESVWTRAQRLGAVPDNVFVLLQPELREFSQLGFAILPAPLTQRHTYTDLTEWFDGASSSPGLVRIGLAHGSVQGILAEEIDSANPFAADRAASARLDYLALGDWHGLKQIDARTWYSGTPEQERFKENGAGQVLLVTIAAPGVEPVVEPIVEPIATSQFQWQQWHINLTVSSDLQQLQQRLAGLTAPAVLDLKFSGEIDLASQQQLLQTLAKAEAEHRSLQWDLSDLRLTPSDDDITALHADGYVGEVLAELRDRQQGEQAATAREALSILASLLTAREGDPAS